MENAHFILIIAVLAFFAYRWMKFRSLRQQIPELLRSGARIVDVRSPQEFASGHVEGSLNIPLSEIEAKSKGILDPQKPVIVCCASGTRSGMAATILRRNGFQVVNGGSWYSLRS